MGVLLRVGLRGQARRLLAAASEDVGAFSFEGQMVDAPLFRQAEAIARRADG